MYTPLLGGEVNVAALPSARCPVDFGLAHATVTCRGKGVGSMLMRWAEQTSESIMLREVPTLAGVDKCRMLLRVSFEEAS